MKITGVRCVLVSAPYASPGDAERLLHLVEANRTRRPYMPIPPETVDQFRRHAEEQFPDLLWRG